MTEPLTVPRHTEVSNVRSYLRAPAFAAKAGGLGRLAAPFVRLGSRLGPAGPSEASRRKSRFAVVAEARGPGGEAARSSSAATHTASPRRLIVAGAQALMAGEARGAGVLAPAEAFDARTLAGRLAPLLDDCGLMSSGPALTVRAMQRLRNLSEAECYARCYGWRREDGVRVVSAQPRRPRYETPVSGELLRALFEDKLDAREPEAA